jgi:hypothetical protein
MTDQLFSLIPFAGPNIPEITISGTVDRQQNLLTIHYALAGRVDDILFPARSVHPTRRADLWMATCHEFFLAIPDQPQYWEFNLSPSGHWNVYRMDRYRRVGFREETLIQRLPFECREEADCFSMHATVDLSPIIQKDDVIRAGITSVVQTKTGYETYWALAHPASQADFHVRESFVINL